MALADGGRGSPTNPRERANRALPGALPGSVITDVGGCLIANIHASSTPEPRTTNRIVRGPPVAYSRNFVTYDFPELRTNGVLRSPRGYRPTPMSVLS